MKKLYIFLFVLSAFAVTGQTYNMNNTNVTTCSGTFYDSGGAGGGYQASENYTKTFCPTSPGAKVILNFTAFDLESPYDYLYIYDGTSTAAPLVGTYTGFTGPGTIQASAGNSSGCLTIRFTSDGSVQYTGWTANISCYNPCQTITSVLNSSSPAASGGIIRACVGQPVTFNGSGNFSVSGAGATYSWNFGNGTTGSGTTGVATYTAPGSYFVNLNILAGGCGNTNNLNQIVQIGTVPTSSSSVANPTVCLGQSTTITGSFTPTPFIVNCTPPVSGTTFLPDGSGVSYQTSINVNCFNSGQTLTAANQIQDICLNMEHSYQGDLSIQIVCPNGQTCNLKDYPGGAYNYLGAPLDDPAVGPGVGANYCFSMSGSVLLCNGPTTANQGNPPYTSITAGTYLPTGNFSSLIGCPLNGPWTIRVTDNLFSDNGYIFNWDLNFAPALLPASANSFTPTIISQTWTGPNIGPTAGPNANVTPTSTGTQCYTLTAVDNFGCSYTRVQCFNVINGPFAGVSNTLAVCSSAAATNLFPLLGSGVSTTGTWSGPAPALTGGNLGTFNPALYTAGTYNYTYTVPGSGGCPASSAVIGATIRPNPSATLTFTNPSCGNNNGVIVINNTSSGGQTIASFASSAGTVSGQTVTGLAAGTHVITLTNNFGCTFTVSATLSNSPPITDVALTPNNIICGAGTGSITIGAVTGGTPTYLYNVNGGGFSASPPVTGLASGTYAIGVRDANGCVFTKTVAITVTPGPTAIAGNTTPAACSAANGSYTVTGVTGGTPAYSFSVDAVATGSVTGSLASGTHTITVRDANGCTFSTTFNITNLTGPTAANVSTVSASCGMSNGSATVTSVAGGTAPYQYSFNGGGFSTTNTVGSLTAGTKTVVVRDANNCTYTLNFTIPNLGSPTSSVSATSSVSCNGGANGSITVSTSGGTPAYSYTIVPTNATNGIGIFNGLTAQSYTINVRDASGCITSVTQVIAQPAALTLTLAPTNINCNGGSTGSIAATSGGGTGTHQYSLNGGGFQASGSFTGLTAGTYTVQVRDANNCTFNQITTITQPTPLALTFTTSPNSCLGAVGAATIGVTGGVPAYSYSVDAVTSANPSTGLGTGTHTATVRDANGCIINGTFNITILAGPSAATITTTNASCGASNGSATVTAVSGGVPAYQYSFNGGAFGASTTVGGLTAGQQTLTVRDANNCTYTVNFNINNTGSPTATVTAVSNVACNGASTGSLTVNASGGTPGYSYTLTPGGTVNTTGIFTGLNAQPYTIAVRDALGCIVSVTTTVTQPAALTLTLTPFNVNCNAGTNGSVTAVAANGTGAYQYSLNGGAFQAGASFTGLVAGTYSVTVRDANNCVLTSVTTITQPTALTRTFTTTPNSCAGSVGSVTISAAGGTPAYTYSVDGTSSASTVSPLTTGNHTFTVRDAQGCIVTSTFAVNGITGPATATIVTANAACGSATGASTVTGVTGGTAAYQYSFDGGPFAATNVKTGLSSGSHTVTILDANTCTLSVLYNVANNGSPTMSLTTTSNVLCNGANTGSFVVTASGGSGGPFTYTLTTPFQTNNNGQFTNLPAGIYSINAKDIAGCLTSMTVNISQPTPLTVTLTAVPARCFGASTGTVNAGGAGGTPAYQYQINGTGYQASGTFPTMPANTHIVQVRDANGCTATQTVTVTQPPVLAVNTSAQNANCTAANGIASSTVTGGTPPYNYNWTGGGGTGPITGGLVSGTYSVTITDANGCTTNGTSVIGNTPGGTAAITGSTNITCNGSNNGVLTANMVTSGTSPFTYSWTPGGQTSSTASNLAPGTYTCVIRDFYGCIATAVGTLTQPAPLTAIMNSNNVKCFGTATGTVSAAGTGGTIPYTYLWPTLASTLTTVNNVAIGTYTCQITDANNCTISPTIAVTQPSSVTLSASVTPANCNQANGSATVTALGGTPAYTYTWSSGSTSNMQNSLPAATYTIQVRDANNCTYTVSTTIPNLSGPTISITSFTNVSCFGGNNGVAIAQGSGGTGTLSYNWNGGQVTSTATNLNASIHTVTVTDQSGCIASTSVSISQPNVLAVTITASQPKCFGSTTGSGLANVTGGTSAYTYAWSGGGSNPNSPLLPAGSYFVNVTDAKGCTATATMSLVNPPAMSAGITSTNVNCFAACNGVATATTTNNIGIVTYHWVGGPSPVTAQTVNGLCAGVYTVTATDQNTCTASAQVIITQPTQVTANITSSSSVTCSGGNNGSAQVSPGGGTGAYTYTWTGAAAGSSANANSLPAGTYSVTVGDANGCTAVTQVTIQQPTPLATTLTTTNPKCNGSTDGTGNLAFTGGAGAMNIQWLPGFQTGNAVNNLAVGPQTVTITYNATCPTILTFTLTQPPLLTAAVTATASNCGQSNGDAAATVGGGTGAYSYLWSNGVTSLNNPNILAAAHGFTVTDANNCKAYATALVNDIAGPSVAVTSTLAVKCFNGNDGAATTTITGGVTPYVIAWNNNPATTQNVNNFTSGPHNITVTDAAGCVGTASVIISQPTQLLSGITSFSNVTCFGLTNGQATMGVSGGTPGYSYTWTPSAQTSSVLANVGANTYTCNVTDGNHCPTSQVVTITQPQALVMTASSFTNISCFGGNNGQISTTVQGGTPGYTYNWVPAQPNSGVLGGLSAGAYSVTVTDTKTCSISANFTILEPSALTSNYTSTPAKCGLANGAATVTVGGGTPTYTLNWNIGAQQGTTATGMGPGSNWTCVITDTKGCTRTQTVNIANAASPVITSVVANPTSCYNTQDGSIAVTYTLGTPGYTVSWSNPINPATQVTASQTQSVSGVGFGAYTMTVTDTYGCSASGFANVNRPGFLGWAPVATQTVCYGQSTQVSANAVGGTAPYTYTWSPAFAVNTAGPHTTPTLTTTTQYNVNMTDANNCPSTPTVVVVSVTQPLAITGHTAAVCHGAVAPLTPTVTSPGRGTQFITYNWTPGGATSPALNVTGNIANAPNMYTVTISDGCTSPTASYVFTVDVNPIPTGTVTASTNTLCAPGAVTFSVNSSSSNTFVWFYNNKDVIGNGQQVIYNAPKADTIRVKVVMTNQFGCTADATLPGYVVAYDRPVAAFIANPQTTSIIDPLIAFANTSTGGSTYSWSFGDPAATSGGNFSSQFSPSHMYSFVGVYTVNLVVTSVHGCTDETSEVVEITADFALYIPNTFTPDGNNLNDFFQPMGVGINEDNYRMDIYDRWGEQVFTSNNFRKGWDGSVKGSGSNLAEEGVYIYKITVYDMQGNKHPFIGHITVLKSE